MSMEEKKLSSAMRIFEALSGVDEELLVKAEEAVTPKGLGRNRGKIVSIGNSRYAGTLVAAACVLIVCFALWTTGGYKYATTENAADSAAPAAAAEEAANEAAVEMSLADREAAAAMPEEAPAESEISEPESGSISSGGGQESLKDGNTTDSGNEGPEGLQEMQQNIQEVQPEESGSAVVESCMKDPRPEITEVDARAVVVLGEYIPTAIPTGYAWESGRANISEETGEYVDLYLTWTQGMDSISIDVSVVDAQEIQLINIEESATYDVHLYEIPYADTVPKEYRESFNQPVFAEEDFSLQVVEARMKSVADVGDTDTPRGNFAVLYEEGVLVQFNGRGTAQEIWEMFQSIQ